MLRQVLGPLLVVTAFVPFAVGQHSWSEGASGPAATLAVAFAPLALVIAASLWMRSRTAVVR